MRRLCQEKETYGFPGEPGGRRITLSMLSGGFYSHKMLGAFFSSGVIEHLSTNTESGHGHGKTLQTI